MSNTSVLENIHRAYFELFPDDDERRLRFLHSEAFYGTLQHHAETVCGAYNVTPDDAIDELRRFLAIKIHTGDGCGKDYPVLLTPTELSKFCPLLLVTNRNC
jgi:hypothetical protein